MHGINYQGDRAEMTALPQWMYRNPELIADGLIALTNRRKKAEETRAKIAAEYRIFGRRLKARKIKKLVKQAKLNGGTRGA